MWRGGVLTLALVPYLVIVGVVPVGAQSNAAPTRDAVQAASCDERAADPADPDKPANVAGTSVVAAEDAAVLRCMAMVLASGSKERRAHYQLGRALEATGEAARALDSYRTAADLGSTAAMVALARLYDTGRGVAVDAQETQRWLARAGEAGNTIARERLAGTAPQPGRPGDILVYGQARAAFAGGDHVTARRLFEPLAFAGHASAQFYLGFMHRNGQGGPQNDAEAARWYGRAAAQGHATAQNNLGVMYAFGQGVAKNDAEALRWFTRAAQAGLPVAQFQLSVIYREGNPAVAADPAAAIKWGRAAAEKGYTPAQVNLGLAYVRGYGVPADLASAADWFRKAAAAGDVRGQFFYGDALARGDGVAQNDAEAAIWMRKAADKGHVDAQYSLAVMFANGVGIAQSYAEAAAWYRRAADQGHAWAQYRLGAMSANGQGVPQDLGESIRWYTRAAEQGHGRALYILGMMNAAGQGMPRDYIAAYRYLKVAVARLGDDEFRSRAADGLARLAGMLNDTQRAEAERQAAALTQELRGRAK